MLRKTGVEEEAKVGVLKSGKIFWLSGVNRYAVEWEEESNLIERINYDNISRVEAKVWKTEAEEDEEEYSHLMGQDEGSSQARYCV